MNDTDASPARRGGVIEVPAQHFTRNDERDLPVPIANATPMSMLATAVQRGMDVATIKDLMDLNERWEKNEARKAYAAALAAFKENAPVVVKDKKNIQYESMYASIGNLVNTVNAALSVHGLSAHWDIDQANGIQVSCVLTHRAGHSETVSMKGPADDSGKKNPLQQIKSTVTYLKIATFEAVTGIASTDGNDDDDGNGSGSGGGKKAGMPSAVYEDWVKKIQATTTPEAAKEVWRESAKSAREYGDVLASADLKQALLEHGEFMAGAGK